MIDPKEKQFNLKRKLWHLLGLIIPFLLFIDIFRFLDPSNPHITRYIGAWMILIFLIFLIVIEIIRFNVPSFNKIFIRVVGQLLKENEYNQIHGSISYILANLILFFFFTKETIVIASLILMVCDPIAAYFGIYYGKRKLIHGKSLEGLLAFLISSFVVSMVFLMILTIFRIGNENLYLTSENFFVLTIIMLITATVSSFVELFSFTTLYGLIDDNLTIPLSASIVLTLSSYFFGLPVNTFFLPLI